MRRKNTKFIAVFFQAPNALQESWTIAKITARCALHNYGCSENFRGSIGTPHGNDILNGLLFSSILWMKFV